MVAQITLPMKCLRQGYRHLRLRNVLNQNLPLSTLFIYSSYEEEGLDIQSDTSLDQLSKNNKLSKIDLNKLDSTKIEPISTSSVKRRMFFLVVHGVIPEESSTILKITQDSTVNDVIAQAQSGTGKTATFVISVLQRIEQSQNECQALILAPTRELAQQVSCSYF